MLKQVEQALGIESQFKLDVMEAHQSLTQVTTRVLEKTQKLMEAEKPDLVLVQGDTTTTMAVALAAFYQRIPVGHIEAGLRTADKFSPFPEEMNRRLTSQLADLHFVPTESARANLVTEHVSPERIFLTGNTGIDSLLNTLDRIRSGSIQIDNQLSHLLETAQGPVTLITLHRRENFGAVHEASLRTLRRVADRLPRATFIFPVHLNPAIREPTFAQLKDAKNVHLLEPLDYPSLIAVMSRAQLIVTDSGGIQEEAPSVGVPTLVLRKNTERMEAVDQGFAKLIGEDSERLAQEILTTLQSSDWQDGLKLKKNPYGDGTASRQIVKHLLASHGRLW
jgi:UDP-N-acetylglucosamine 2-epimerase (non-hydrolysing)